MQLRVKETETIYDVAIKSYGLNNVYKIISDNGLDNITSLIDLQTIEIDTTFIQATPPEINTSTTAAISDIQRYTSKEGQSLYDICLTVYGSIDSIYKLIQDSNIDSTNEGDLRNKVFTYSVKLQADSLLVNHIIKSAIVFSTLDTSSIIQMGDGYVDAGYVDIDYL